MTTAAASSRRLVWTWPQAHEFNGSIKGRSPHVRACVLRLKKNLGQALLQLRDYDAGSSLVREGLELRICIRSELFGLCDKMNSGLDRHSVHSCLSKGSEHTTGYRLQERMSARVAR